MKRSYYIAATLLIARVAHAAPLERVGETLRSPPVIPSEKLGEPSANTDAGPERGPWHTSGLSASADWGPWATAREQPMLASTLDDLDAASELLPEPEALEDKIHFWESIYLRHGSDRVVIHDRDMQSVVWRVVELPKLPSGEVDEKAAKILLAAEMDDVKERLARLALTLTPRDDEDRALLMLAGDGTISYLDGAIDRLRIQRGVADKFALAQQRAAKLRATIEKTLTEEGVPKELAMLPFIESMYNPTARSSVGALGLWQLMPSTARWLGLTVNKRQDDRLDGKATQQLHPNHDRYPYLSFQVIVSACRHKSTTTPRNIL